MGSPESSPAPSSTNKGLSLHTVPHHSCFHPPPPTPSTPLSVLETGSSRAKLLDQTPSCLHRSAVIVVGIAGDRLRPSGLPRTLQFCRRHHLHWTHLWWMQQMPECNNPHLSVWFHGAEAVLPEAAEDVKAATRDFILTSVTVQLTAAWTPLRCISMFCFQLSNSQNKTKQKFKWYSPLNSLCSCYLWPREVSVGQPLQHIHL